MKDIKSSLFAEAFVLNFLVNEAAETFAYRLRQHLKAT